MHRLKRDSGRVQARIDLACAWGGVAFLVLFVLGWVVLARFVPPPRPAASGAAIRAFFLDRLFERRLGLLLAMCAWSLLLPWGVAVASQTTARRTELAGLRAIQIGCAVSTMALGVLMFVIWTVATFRPAGIDPDITRTLNDLGWFIFLIDWAPVTVWCWAVGAAILMSGPELSFPRWSAYASFWAGAVFMPAGLIVFFKSGVFDFAGLLAFYLPAAVFFAWFALMTALTVRSADLRSIAPITDRLSHNSASTM